ncbi:MAG: major-like protein ous protein, partial [uncultured bacterium (gcode 4)]
SARDSTRLSDMSNIAKWLSVFNASAWTYPKPDSSLNNITITASWTTIGYQWYAGPTVLGIVKLSNWWKDPLDQTHYTYSVNTSQSKFQLLGFLEDWSNVALSYAPHGISAFAGMTEGEVNADPSSYSGRYVLTKGDQLWVILNSWSMVPAQIVGTPIDILTTTWSYIVQFSNKDKINWTWSSLYIVSSTMKTWWSKFPWCDKYDVVIGSQTWARCNSVLWDWSEWGVNASGWIWTVSASIWCFNYAWVEDETNCVIWSIEMASSSKENSWSNASSISWTVDNVWWKFYTWDQAVKANNACPAWWHLPTDSEWSALELTLAPSCTDTSSVNTWRCAASWLGWQNNASKNSTDNIIRALDIPLWGIRDSDGITFRNRGHGARFWSSSASGSTYYGRFIGWSNAGVYRNLYDKSYGLSVRCLKN